MKIKAIRIFTLIGVALTFLIFLIAMLSITFYSYHISQCDDPDYKTQNMLRNMENK